MAKRIFKRKIYNALLDWKKKRNGETALLIEGARRIGKSTIVEEFARNEYASYLLIDFSIASQKVKGLFDNLLDLDYLFMQLQFEYNVRLIKGKSLIIFDEVQFAPKARQAIKHLVKDGRYHYIETGSLISIRKNTKDILIPSEETRINMYPMDFEEFMNAIDKGDIITLLKECYQKKICLGDAAHRAVMRDFRLYMLVGGMPQAVEKYIDTGNLMEVDMVKRTIISLYVDDLLKIDPTGKLGALFKAIPSQLSKNASRYQTTSILQSTTYMDSFELINTLEDSKIVNVVFHSDDPNVGLPLTMDISKYKMFICDTGLFVTLTFMDKDFTENIIYNKLLSDKLSVNLGYVYENMVAQMLRSAGYELFYHTFLRKDMKSYYEIDFVISQGNKIIPIEVKSSGYKSHSSLDHFVEKYSSRVIKQYLLYTKDYSKKGNITYLPIYMTSFI